MANQQQQPWFKTDPNKGMQERVKAIEKMRDPGTFADEMMIGAKSLLWLSLIFTGALCFFSYTFFLERFLSPTISMIAAVLVTVLIEYGKQRIGLNAIRMPFLQGWVFIFARRENTFMFAGAAIFALLIFSISVYNSTNGAAKYAEQTATARTEQTFTANTATLDAEIQSVQTRLNNAPKAKWKGREYYQDAKSVREAEKSLASLQSQREKEVERQRADFERSRGHSDSANQHSASIALRVGGWLEAVQVILLLLIASCERVLDRRMQNQHSPTPPAPQQGRIGFQPNTQPAVSNSHGAENNATPTRSSIGFKNYSTAPPPPNPVAQPAQPVPQNKGLLEGADADAAIRYHLSALKKEPSHFARHDAKKETVYLRIVKALDGMIQTLHGVSWCSASVYAEVYDYMEATVLPTMREHGLDYNTNELYTMLYQRTRAGEGPTA